MPIKKHNAPPGLDYAPITGENPDLSYGTVQADAGAGQPRRRLEDVIVRRLYPTERPGSDAPWDNPTAEEWDVLLPKGAPDELRDPQQLCRAYHLKAGDKIQHLATVISLRFAETEAVPPRMRLHEAWELSRGFGLHLCGKLEVAVVAAMHVPGRSWGLGVPHTHLICPCRVIRSSTGFSTFTLPLINPDEGRPLIDAEWKAYRKEAGYAQ
jgi:hypothetical protein